MSNRKIYAARVIHALSITLGAIVIFGSAMQAKNFSAEPQETGGVSVKSSQDESLTKDERDRVVAKTLAHPRVVEKLKGHRTRAVRVTRDRNSDGAIAIRDQASSASVTFFDYTTGKTTRYTIDLRNGELLREQALPGHPQSSQEERDDATVIIQQDRELSSLLQSGHKLIGGFIVDAPSGTVSWHRYMQMRIVTEDMKRTGRVVIIDLTDRVIAFKGLSDN
jgi:hypothetical protein